MKQSRKCTRSQPVTLDGGAVELMLLRAEIKALRAEVDALKTSQTMKWTLPAFPNAVGQPVFAQPYCGPNFLLGYGRGVM